MKQTWVLSVLPFVLIAGCGDDVVTDTSGTEDAGTIDGSLPATDMASAEDATAPDGASPGACTGTGDCSDLSLGGCFSGLMNAGCSPVEVGECRPAPCSRSNAPSVCEARDNCSWTSLPDHPMGGVCDGPGDESCYDCTNEDCTGACDCEFMVVGCEGTYDCAMLDQEACMGTSVCTPS